MNREILFRAKRIDTGDWITGSYLQHSGRHEILHKYSDEPDDYDACAVNPATIGQFTGLAVKNRPLYEGDRIVCNKHPKGATGIVVYKQASFRIEWEQPCEWNDLIYVRIDGIEIIGTIHDK